MHYLTVKSNFNFHGKIIVKVLINVTIFVRRRRSEEFGSDLRKPQRVRLSLSVIKLSLHNNVHMKNGRSFIKYCIIQHNCTFVLRALCCVVVYFVYILFSQKNVKKMKKARVCTYSNIKFLSC